MRTMVVMNMPQRMTEEVIPRVDDRTAHTEEEEETVRMENAQEH
jgi:hypothetical protein